MLNIILMLVTGLLLTVYGFYVIIFHQKIWNRCMERVNKQTVSSLIDKARKCSKLSRQINRFFLAPFMIVVGLAFVYLAFLEKIFI